MSDQPTHDEKVRAALLPTRVEMDWRVQTVLAFMQQVLPADDLRGVAEAVASIAPAIWSHHQQKHVTSISLACRLG